MGTVPANVQPFPGQGADAWIEAYKEEVLAAKDAATEICRVAHHSPRQFWPVPSPGDDTYCHRVFSRYAAQFQL